MCAKLPFNFIPLTFVRCPQQLRRIGWMMELVCPTQPSDSPKAPATSTADSSHSWSNHSQRGTLAPNDATAATANVTWKPVFLAVSEDNLLLYHHAPQRLEEWQRPAHSNALIATRVVDVPPLGIAGSLRVPPPLNSRLTAQTRLLDMLVFTVRTGK
ncbi:structural molecule activity [Sparganum proliferum]